ncbi:hypothetical protein H6G35_28910 [Aulosira sp. FACHB-113]|uniref:hypothetical protein n=1 Tax=Tolypothrix tenuis TaxID=457083 RepID=UPI001684A49E|nr:hypothetical protein [Aulosira sp. FACHB-113]
MTEAYLKQLNAIACKVWCHWKDNLAVKDILCFQSRSGQIIVLSPKLKRGKGV